MHVSKDEFYTNTETDRQRWRDRDRGTKTEAHTQGGLKIEINLVRYFC